VSPNEDFEKLRWMCRGATSAMLWRVLKRGAQVYRQPAPFAHSKRFIVDDCDAIVGSGNFDQAKA